MLQNFSLLYGYSVEDLLIDVLLGKDIEPLPNRERCVADVFLPIKKGNVKKISSIEEVFAACSIIDGEIFYHVGDFLTNQHKYTDSAGWVQLEAKSIEEMLEKIDEVYETFVLEVEEVRNEQNCISD